MSEQKKHREKRWVIEQPATGHVLGTYRAEDIEGAVREMCKDAGYAPGSSWEQHAQDGTLVVLPVAAGSPDIPAGGDYWITYKHGTAHAHLMEPADKLALWLWYEQDPRDPAYGQRNLWIWWSNRTLPRIVYKWAAAGDVEAMARVRTEAGLPVIT